MDRIDQLRQSALLELAQRELQICPTAFQSYLLELILQDTEPDELPTVPSEPASVGNIVGDDVHWEPTLTDGLVTVGQSDIPAPLETYLQPEPVRPIVDVALVAQPAQPNGLREAREYILTCVRDKQPIDRAYVSDLTDLRYSDLHKYIQGIRGESGVYNTDTANDPARMDNLSSLIASINEPDDDDAAEAEAFPDAPVEDCPEYMRRAGYANRREYMSGTKAAETARKMGKPFDQAEWLAGYRARAAARNGAAA